MRTHLNINAQRKKKEGPREKSIMLIALNSALQNFNDAVSMYNFQQYWNLNILFLYFWFLCGRFAIPPPPSSHTELELRLFRIYTFVSRCNSLRFFSPHSSCFVADEGRKTQQNCIMEKCRESKLSSIICFIKLKNIFMA